MTSLLAIDSVIVLDRQRKDFSPKQMQELKVSIVSKGLLHAPVLRLTETGEHRLVAGGRRLKAIQELHEEGIPFGYSGSIVPEGKLPYTLLADLSEADILETELEENIIRSALTWQEEAEARTLIHRIRQTKNPVQSVSDTAKETSKIMGASERTERRKIANALLISSHKDNPKVKAARNEREAVTAILDDIAKVYTNKLAEKTFNFTSQHSLILGDCKKELLKLAKGKFSAIICDPPYGIDADKMKKDELHLYRDDATYARDICETVIREGFSLCKEKAFLFLFCDIDHFVHLRNYASQHAWSVWRAPIIWCKGTDGHAPWGRAGFIRTYEVLLFAVKGAAELLKPGGPDVINFKRPKRADRVHAAEKPRELLSYLLSLSTVAGDSVLDPCAGSGSLIPAADDRKVSVTAIESSELYFEELKSKTIKKEPTTTAVADDGEIAF
jgi:DNA modification methylase